MFDHPDADYIQDLLVGYVLGKLDQVETAYLQQQIEQDPYLNQALRQLENALDSMTIQLSDPFPPVESELYEPFPSVGSTTSVQQLSLLASAVSPTIEHAYRKTTRWLVWVSVWVVALVIAMSLPLLLFRSRLPQRSFEGTVSSRHTKTPAADVWQGIQPLLIDHLAASQHTLLTRSSVAAEQGESDIDDIKVTLNHVLPETGTIAVVKELNTTLLGSGYYEQGHLKGLRFSYELADQEILSFYQLQGKHLPLFPLLVDQVYIESDNGLNALLWAEQDTLYAMVAKLPMDRLQTLANTVELE